VIRPAVGIEPPGFLLRVRLHRTRAPRKECLMVFLVANPSRYVFENCVTKPGGRWRRSSEIAHRERIEGSAQRR
jgi:hypothetical protein